MDLVLDAVCVVDSEGRFVYVSAGCERLLGYTQEELIGRNMIEFVFPQDRERTLEAAADIMCGHPRMNFENRYLRKDGLIVHIMWSARWSVDDRVRVAVARDVTELKNSTQIQDALYQITATSHATDELTSLCRHIHQIIGNLIPVKNFSVALYDASNSTLTFPYSVDKQVQNNVPQPLVSETLIAEIIRTGSALLLSDSGTDMPMSTTVTGECLNWLGVPLYARKGIFGVLVVQTGSSSIGYTKKDKDLLQFVSTQITDVIERKQAEILLRHMAGHDELTDLPNRALFYDRFDMALKRAHRDKEHLALLYMDLDGFKLVNDTFGHDVGDQVLREVGQRLIQCVRTADTIGRHGGDEFTALLTNIHSPTSIDTIVKKIQAAVKAPYNINGRQLSISVSIGSAVYPENGDDKEQLIRHADASMYAMKRHRKSENE